MEALPQSYRGIQRNPKPGTIAYRTGKKQTAIAIKRYHILCALLQNKCVLCDVVPIEPFKDAFEKKNIPYVRATMNFEAYHDACIDPIKKVEIRADEQGTERTTSVDVDYGPCVEDDWRIQAGGVLCALGEYGDFFSYIQAYHNREWYWHGVPAWETLFQEMENSGYRKNIIPCMHFGQVDGCLDASCPFLHDRRAVLASRAQVIKKRRKMIGNHLRRPNVLQHSIYHSLLLDQLSGGNEARRAELDKKGVAQQIMAKDKGYCSNKWCMKPWTKGQEKTLKECSRCKLVKYCSPECQTTDWPRHKKDPCAPMEVVIENDNCWNPNGTRKGTNFFKTWKDARSMKAYGVSIAIAESVHV